VTTAALAAPVAAGAAAGALRPTASSGDPVATATQRVAAARQQADALASRYFGALNRGAALDVEITNLEARLRDDEARASALRARASLRARQLYETGGSPLADFFNGEDPLDNARRTRLVAAANARDDSVFSDLARQNEAMRSRRKRVRDDQSRQRQVTAALRGAQTAMDAQLTAAQQALTDARAVVAVRAAQQAAASTPQPGSTQPRATPRASPPVIATPPIGPAPLPGGGGGGGGGGSHHDDPFLSCTRARESHGNYGVVNPAGPWYGAYQFAQSTWNSAANHAGRLDLVGVQPNTASPADQDEIAWALYQWQGKGPWGGRC
jgi:hypothetical protein